MKKWTKILCLLLAAALCAALFAACNGDGGDEAVFLIGGCGPLTGDYANYGTSVRNGAQIAVDEINAAGGVNGFKLVLQYEDTKGSGDDAKTAYGKLMDDGMKVSLGGVLSGENKVVVAEAKDDGILILSPSASALESIAGNDAAFRVCFNDPAQGVIPADVIADTKMAEKVAVFYGSDNDYCVGLYESFKTECEKKGIQIVDVQTFTSGTSTDFSTQINSIKNSGATLVFLPIYAAEAATFLTQAKDVLTDVKFFGCDGLDGILTKVSDVSLVEGLLVLTPFAADEPGALVKNFVTEYKKRFNTVPDQFAADGYDAVYSIVEAMKKAAVTPENVKDSGFNASMVAAMTQISVTGLTGTLKWTADGETDKAVKVMVIKNGAYQYLEGYEG